MDKWIAIVKNKDGTIRIFDKFTDEKDLFVEEVRGWTLGEIRMVYRESDIVQKIYL